MLMMYGGATAPAEIRGFIGGNAIPTTEQCDGQNAGNPNVIQFSSSSNQRLPLGNLTAGLNAIAYNFTLCATGAFAARRATAQATVNITWE